MSPQARLRCRLSLTTLSLVCILVAPRANAVEAPAAPAKKVREPAVAGLFYPKDPAELSKMIDACLVGAKVEPPAGELKAFICPHAGYPYSGPVAAFAYRLLAGHDYATVVVLGPSHYADLRAASVTNADLFRTPLGDVPVSAKARALAQLRPFALEPPCLVQRPDWWRQSSRPAPAEDTADTWEHSVEVEVPFLQRTLKSFELVPVVCGEIDEEKAAGALLQILDDRTLIVASSDLSHYYSYATARDLDQHTVEAICRLDPNAISDGDACGHTPIRTLLYVARQRGWQARLLDCRNSGDITGDKSRVVGYAAIAFYAPASASVTAPAAKPIAAPASALFTAANRRYLLDLARKTVQEAATTGQLPEVSADGLTPKFTAAKGCFVTLTKRGELRGCIGYILPQGPLYRAVVENARNAAIRDPRFPAVRPGEVSQLEIEISVLTKPLPLFFSSPEDLLHQLRPGVDGVVLQIGNRSATYLPQVWEQIPDKVDFLNNLSEKAGCESSAWREPGVSVFIYHVESFKESDKETTDGH
jgi:AmmeMemoRadiSam system protein A